jgi:hypothetical protein
MLILLAGIGKFLLKIEELTLPAVTSVASAPNKYHSGMLSSIPGLPEKWTTSEWNQWTASTGIGGQLGMEWLDNFKWIGWTTSTGPRNLLNEAQKGYSYGIAGRDSWGCDVSKKHKLLVHQYDCFDTARPVCDGGRFEFHEECLGSSNEEIEGRRFNSLAAQIEENGDLGKWLLIKMDIEGAEAESLLATPSPVLEKVIQLVVEFHDVDNPQYLQVIKYLKKTFYVVDVHFNKFGCKDRVSPFPGVVYEVLFVNKRFGLVSTTESRPIYPNPLWRPNSPELSDCQKEIR